MLNNNIIKYLKQLKFLAVVLVTVLVIGSGLLLTSCSGDSNDNTLANKANIIEVPTIKIYKDRGDAADAFFAASRAEMPVLLYFYTDS